MDPTYIIQLPDEGATSEDNGWSDASLVSVSVLIGIGVGLVVVVCIHFGHKREAYCRRRCCSRSEQRKSLPRRLVFVKDQDLFRHGSINDTYDNNDVPESTPTSRNFDFSNIQSHQAMVENAKSPYTSLSKLLFPGAFVPKTFRNHAHTTSRRISQNGNGLDGLSCISSISSGSDSGCDPIDQEDLMYSSTRTGLQLDFDMNDESKSRDWYDSLSPSTQASSSNDTNMRSPSSVLQFSSLFSSEFKPHSDFLCKDTGGVDDVTDEEFMVFPTEDETKNNFYRDHGISAISTRCQSLFTGSLSFLSFSTTSNESESNSAADFAIDLDDDAKPRTFARTWNQTNEISIV